jgi:hypothetical protein
MESLLPTIASEDTLPATNTPPLPQGVVLVPASHLKKNIYPAARHILLIIIIIFALCVIVFLIHQNGKSIYDNGL